MVNNSPRVSLGLPVFNGEQYLARAIDSVLAQDYTDFELIICDNASTDGTGRICESYARRDSRIRYFRNEANIGLAPNHNRVFALARGEFFKWVAHDDECPERMLGRFVNAFDNSPSSVAVVYSVCEYIDELGNQLGTFSDRVNSKDSFPHRRLARLLQHIDIYNCTYGLIRSSSLRKTRLHGSFPIADRVLFSELAIVGQIVELPQPLLRIRIHGNRSMTRYKDPDALRLLFDPRNGRQSSFLSIEGRVQIELLKAAWLTPASVLDKLSCSCVALLAPSWRNFRGFAGRQRRRLARALVGKSGSKKVAIEGEHASR